MAAKSPLGGSDLRIVILGNAVKNKLVKSVLNCENLTGEKVGFCTLHQSEQAGRKISVVEAPGWDRLRPNRIKEEIVRSVSLCPPGPHALLLVIPVKTPSKEPSVGEINASEKHMRLLSERVWKHTIVLFACDDGVDDQTIQKHIHSAEKILEKCGKRFHILQKSTCESPTQIHELLLNKIDILVEENHGDFFIPQAYYELIKLKTQEASETATELRKRRGSLDSPPNYNKDTGDSEKKESVETSKHRPSEDMPKITMDFKQFVMILMAAFGALLGAVAGAQNGVSGACSGLVLGVVAGVLLASFIVYNYTHIYSRAYPKQPTQSSSQATES